MFVYVFSILCNTVQDKELFKNQQHQFIFEVTDEDDMGVVSITNLSKSNGLRVTTNYNKIDDSQSSEEIFDEMGDLVETNWEKKFKNKGNYSIQITNRSLKPVQYSISTYKIGAPTEEAQGFELLRNVLQHISNAMDSLKSENYYFHTQQNKNIKQAANIRLFMRCLVIFPILTLVIGWAKHKLARAAVKPNKKKFKNVF